MEITWRKASGTHSTTKHCANTGPVDECSPMGNALADPDYPGRTGITMRSARHPSLEKLGRSAGMGGYLAFRRDGFADIVKFRYA